MKGAQIRAKTAKPARKKKAQVNPGAPGRTFEQVLEEQAAWEIANPSGGGRDRLSPLARWFASSKLETMRGAFEDGEQYALMLAIGICATNEMVMPEWLAKGYLTAFDKVHNFKAKSWDAAFGKPLPKGARQNAQRKKILLQDAVFNEVRDRKKHEPVSVSLFESVGEKFGIKKTLVQEYYYSHRDYIVAHSKRY